MVAVSPVKGRFFFFFFFPLDPNGQVLWFLRRKFDGGEIWDKRSGAYWGLFDNFFFLSFYMRYYIKLIILVYV